MIEKRFAQIQSNEDGVCSGYAVLWGKEAYIPQLGKKERFAKGSLSIPKNGISCYFQHKKDLLLGHTASKTLKVIPDDVGLKFEVSLPESQKAIRESMRRGDVRGASIAFYPKKESYKSGCREITEAMLSEISLVSDPCHFSPVKYRDKGNKRPKVKWSKFLWGY